MNCIPLNFRSTLDPNQTELLKTLTMNIADQLKPLHNLSLTNRRIDITLLTGTALNIRTAISYANLENNLFISYNLRLATVKIDLFLEVSKSVKTTAYSKYFYELNFTREMLIKIIEELWNESKDNSDWEPHGDSF